MLNIFKYPLRWLDIQEVKCRSVEVLAIQLQNGIPTMWVLENQEFQLRNVNVELCRTGENVMIGMAGNKRYISTTQINGFVWHWFVKEVN